MLNQERYKRRWCLCIKGKKENVNQNPGEEVVKLLCKITLDLADKMEDAIDIVQSWTEDRKQTQTSHGPLCQAHDER